MICETKSITVS